MRQMFINLFLALTACAAAQPALLPDAPLAASFAAATAPYINYPAMAAPFAAPLPAPLAVSSSQRLDYFNQFNAAFAPPSRLLATPAGFNTFPTVFGFPAATRFGQPARLVAAAPAAAPFIF